MRFVYLLPCAWIFACDNGPINTTTKPSGDDVPQGDPNISVEVEYLDFGELGIGSTGSETLVVRNIGVGILNLESVSVSAPFTTTAGSGLEIQPGTSLPVTVQFIPTTYAAVEGALSITSNDPDQGQISLPIYGRVITDEDGDGYASPEAGGDDCDDSDPTIHPGAEDEWYDGIDSNCEEDDDYDQDGDGYQTSYWNEDAASGGGDCQDANPEMYPGAEDIWYDGVDSDCAGNDDYDQDGDGSRSLALGRGTDCDDMDPNINTSGIEAFNGKDDDCDGETDQEVPGWKAFRTYLGTAGGDQAGWSITMGDIDSDGRDDLLIGSAGYSSNRGGISVISGDNLPSNNSRIDDAYNFFPGNQNGDQAGYHVGYLEDFTGDGMPSLGVGAPNVNNSQGRVYLIYGDDAYFGGDLDDAYLTVSGTSTHYVGRGFSEDLDLDGDGLDDLFGSYANGSSVYLWLLYGGVTGSYTLSTVDAKFSTNGRQAFMRNHFPQHGDLDGDGLIDAVFCDGDTDGAGSGQVWVLWGDTQRYSYISPANLASVGQTVATGDTLLKLGQACGIGPDWDNDGAGELWVYVPDVGGIDGGLYMMPGSSDMRNTTYDFVNSAPYVFEIGNSPDVSMIRNIGDWDNDGISEIAVGFYGGSGSQKGQVLVYSSQTEPGVYDGNQDSMASIEGDSDYNQAQYGAVFSSRTGDINGDGLLDFVASDYGYLGINGNTDQIGAIYLSYNRSN